MVVKTALEKLLRRVPPEIMSSLSEEERHALQRAATPSAWRRCPINIRISIPSFGRGYYLTLVGGPERRSNDRIKRERQQHPLWSTGNSLFMLGIGAAFYGSIILGFVALTRLLLF